MSKKKTRRGGLSKTMSRARNVMRLMTGQRFTPPYEANYSLHSTCLFARLRHYPAQGIPQNQPVLFIPPLMVTAQVYDISPQHSAIGYLCREGQDVWVLDFGVPESEPGGMERTLDDHILAINAAIDEIISVTGGPLHLAGYSQGGIFVYLTAAFRKSKDIGSVMTFGSPIDMQRNLPRDVDRGLLQNVVSGVRGLAGGAIEGLPGVPGSFSSFAFKMASPIKEVQYLKLMLGILDDREALAKIEPMRRFLGGEGFIAWPGPAFRKFVDDVVVHNRLMKGGIIINGTTVHLGDVTCPILSFVGLSDEFARPKSVRAIRKVTRPSEYYEVEMASGHFGLVVGSRAMSTVWPTVSQWIEWRSGKGSVPSKLKNLVDHNETVARIDESDIDGLGTISRDLFDDVWKKSGDVLREVTDVLSWTRWQTPTILRLANIFSHSGMTLGGILDAQAGHLPDHTFFLWEGRAYSYRQANERVDALVAHLYAIGIRPGMTVGILMDNQPDYLTSTVALNRLGCTAALVNSGAQKASLAHALSAGEAELLLVDAAHIEDAASVLEKRQLIGVGMPVNGTELCSYWINLDFDTPPEVELPPRNPMESSETAMLIYTSGTTGLPKAAKISNRRWFFAASGAAAMAGMTPRDTVYCALPLYHGTGFLLAAGGALVGGSRLMLGRKFSVRTFWRDCRVGGVTIVFYVGEMCRYLVSAPETANEKNHSLRLMVGNGMRADVWSRFLHRFGNIRVVEFYASTEGNVATINLTGDKVGSIGRIPFQIAQAELVRYDVEEDEFIRDAMGNCVPCDADEPGVLISRIRDDRVWTRFEGYVDAGETNKKILRDVFEAGDRWFNTGDLLKRDDEGDYWFVDRLGDTFRWKGENISTEEVNLVMSKLDWIAGSTVYGVKVPDQEGRVGMVAIELKAEASFEPDELYSWLESQLPKAAIPRFVRLVESLDTTGSFKFLKHTLQKDGFELESDVDSIWVWDQKKSTYKAYSSRMRNSVLKSL